MMVLVNELHPILYVLVGVVIAISIQLSVTGNGVSWRWGKMGFGPIVDVIDILEIHVSSVIPAEKSTRWFGELNM